MRQILFAAKITLGGLHGDVAEEELNLLQFAAAEMAQLGAGAPLYRISEYAEWPRHGSSLSFFAPE